MSSSTGVTIGPMEALQLVPPEVMRYLIARNQPKRHIDFDTGTALIELADEYQRVIEEIMVPGPDGIDFNKDWWKNLSRRQQKAWNDKFSQVAYSQIDYEDGLYVIQGAEEYRDGEEWSGAMMMFNTSVSKISFRHLALIAQLRADDEDVWGSLRRSGLLSNNPSEKEILRLNLMRNWIASPHFPEPFRLRIQSDITVGAKQNMDPRDSDYLQALAKAFADCDWNWKTINSHVCNLAKDREMKLRDAFQLMYWIVLDQDFGPKLASILEEMDRQAVLDLLQLAIDELSS